MFAAFVTKGTGLVDVRVGIKATIVSFFGGVLTLSVEYDSREF